MAKIDTINLNDGEPDDDPEVAMRDARQRFIAAFPKRADSVGLLLNMVLTLGPRGPVRPLREIVHRTAGLAGTLGFPGVSDRALELEELLDQADQQLVDGSRANQVFDALRDAFTEDLAAPPVWAIGGHVAAGSRRIMVVEDDEDQREVVAIHLRAAGYVVLPVEQGDKVLEAAQTLLPDLILLDANLPGLDGYSVCRLLKADPRLAGTPVIFTTVRAKADDKAVGLLLGADEYLTKPLDLSEVVLRISILLDRKQEHAPPPAAALTVAGEEPTDLDYETFVAVAREQLDRSPAVLALVRVPEARLQDAYSALRGDLRRRDIVACYDASHLILLMADMPPARAADRLAETVASLGGDSAARFSVGLAHSPSAGARPFEALLGEADIAVAIARRSGVAAAVAGEPAAPAPAQPVRKSTVLLAGIDPDVAAPVESQLNESGYRAVLTADGLDAIETAVACGPDVVVVDMAMTGVSGFDVLARVRQLPARPRVIVLAERGRDADVTRAFALGADDYVTKPANPQELLARIERQLR